METARRVVLVTGTTGGDRQGLGVRFVAAGRPCGPTGTAKAGLAGAAAEVEAASGKALAIQLDASPHEPDAAAVLVEQEEGPKLVASQYHGFIAAGLGSPLRECRRCGSPDSKGWPVRHLEVVRAAYGTAELLAPGAAECLLIARAPDAHARTFIRVLGARHLLQAAATTIFGAGAGLHWISAGADALHALTMLGLAAVDRRRRHAAVANAAIALAFAAGELRSGTPSGRPQVHRGHRVGLPGRR